MLIHSAEFWTGIDWCCLFWLSSIERQMEKKSNFLDPLVFAKVDKPVLGLRKVRSAASLQHLTKSPTPQPATPTRDETEDGARSYFAVAREEMRAKLKVTSSFGSGLFRLQRCQSLVGLLQPPSSKMSRPSSRCQCHTHFPTSLLLHPNYMYM